MSFKDAFKYAENIFHNHTTDTSSASKIPMKAKIGSLLKIQQTPFIRAQAGGSIVSGPNELTEDLVKAIVRVKLGHTGYLYRFFVATQEHNSCDKFIQLFQDEQSSLVEAMYFTTLTRITPNEEEQAIFTGRDGRGLGDIEYKLFREQLTEFGISEDLIKNAVDANGEIVFSREGTSTDNFIAPTEAKETRIEDAAGMNGLSQDLFFTSYSRTTSFGKEVLLIETHIIASEDGDASKRSIYVDFYIGIPLEFERITLQ